MDLKLDMMKKVDDLEKKLKLQEEAQTKAGMQNMSAVWKAKFDEMFKITQNLISENKTLRKDVVALRSMAQQTLTKPSGRDMDGLSQTTQSS